MSNTKFFIWAHQSNGIGKNSLTSASPGNTAPPYYTTRNTGIRALTWDGFLTPGNWSSTISEPWCDPTNAVDGNFHASRAAADTLASLGATGPALPFADYLKEGGSPADSFSRVTDNIVVAPCGLSATYVNPSWMDAGSFATEPNDMTLLGTGKRRLDSVMIDAPNPQIGAVVLCAGESECLDVSPTFAATIQVDLGGVMDQWIAYATARGYTWAKSTCKFLLPQMATGYGSPPLSWPNVTAVQTAFSNLATLRSDTKLITDAFSGAYIHLDKNDNLVRAAAMANAWLAAT